MKAKEFCEWIAILSKYVTDSDYSPTFEHDIMWFLDYNMEMEVQDRKKLEELWFYEDEEAWSTFS